MTTYAPARLETAARAVVRHCDAVLAAFDAENDLATFPWYRIDPIDFRRVMRKREAAVLLLRSVSVGQTPHPTDIGQLLRDDGWQVREIMQDTLG